MMVIVPGIRAMFRRDEPEKGRLDLNEVVREALLLAQGELRHRSIVVESSLDPNLPHIDANRIQLQQVLLNLIGNAIEAMDTAATSARVLRVRTQRNDQEALVTVEDTGPGIDPKGTDHIFEPFFTTKSSGTGLGLPICRTIIDSHGGRIWATSGTTGGTVLQFVLPIGDRGQSDAP